MRYGEATATTTFKCDGCGVRLPIQAMYHSPLIATIGFFVTVCSDPCFLRAYHNYQRQLKERP